MMRWIQSLLANWMIPNIMWIFLLQLVILPASKKPPCFCEEFVITVEWFVSEFSTRSFSWLERNQQIECDNFTALLRVRKPPFEPVAKGHGVVWRLWWKVESAQKSNWGCFSKKQKGKYLFLQTIAPIQFPASSKMMQIWLDFILSNKTLKVTFNQ